MWIDGHVHLTRPLNLLLEEMDNSGLDKALVCSSSVARGETVHTLQQARDIFGGVASAHKKKGQQTIYQVNSELAEAISSRPERLLGMGKVDLFSGSLDEQLEAIVSLGLCGVGEVLGIHGNAGALEPVLAFSQKHGNLPVFVHCDEPVDGFDLQEMFALLRDYPDAKVIVGHLGGSQWMYAVEKIKELPQCRMDVSESINAVPLRVACREIPEKLLFGSDYPWDYPAVNIERLQKYELEKPVLDGIMGNNFREFFEV